MEKDCLIKPELFNSKKDLTYFEYFTKRRPDFISLKNSKVNSNSGKYLNSKIVSGSLNLI